jgi:hypothetical protein
LKEEKSETIVTGVLVFSLRMFPGLPLEQQKMVVGEIGAYVGIGATG